MPETLCKLGTFSGGIAAVALLIAMSACSDPTSQRGPVERGSRAVPVVAEPVTADVRRTRIEAVGTARARRSVSIFAEAAGEVVALNFQPGDKVAAGDQLVALDARDEILALELAEVRFGEAQRLLERYTTANAAVERTVPETTVDAARTALESARIERDIARLALERRAVNAPFDGFVGITEIDVGDRIDPAVEITTLDDRSALLVSFEVPETFVRRIAIGDPVALREWGAGGIEAAGHVVDLGSRVDPVSRSFVARAQVPNEDDALRPGMSFRIELDLESGSFPVVPELAVQWGADGAYVWAVDDGRARRVPVRLVQREAGRALVEGDLGVGEQVVAEGVQSMREGVSLRVMDAAALARDARAALGSSKAEG